MVMEGLCNNDNCPKREKCLRYIAKPNEYTHYISENKCIEEDMFIEVTVSKKKDSKSKGDRNKKKKK